jgi:multiple sugar transport system permease protein
MTSAIDSRSQGWKVPAHQQPRARTFRISRVAVFICLGAVLAYVLLPLWWLVVSSTKTSGELFTSNGMWFGQQFAFESNTRELFSGQGGIFTTWLRNSVLYAGVSGVGGGLLATVAGYGFAKFEFRGRLLALALVGISVLVPTTALGIPLYLLLARVGLINTMLGVILPLMVNPFAVLIMVVLTRDAVPDELLEAARIDGASELRILVSVVSRLLMPGFVTVVLLSFVAAWNNYFLPLLVLNRASLLPLPVGLASWSAQALSFQGSHAGLLVLVIVGSFFTIVPIIIVFIVLQRFWETGLTLGAVQG